jgi:dienelactone hydrolase
MSIVDTGAIVACARSNGVRRLGTVGYCMGASHALGALASYPETIGAAACLHGAAWYASWSAGSAPYSAIDGGRV